MIPIKRINHAVLTVRDLDRSVDFYARVFGFEEIARAGGQMAFMRAPGSANHHDLGFLALGNEAVPDGVDRGSLVPRQARPGRQEVTRAPTCG